MRHLTLMFALLLAVSSTGCTVQFVNPYDVVGGWGFGIGDPYSSCVGECANYGGLPSPAEYRRQRRFYRDLNRLQRRYPHLAACVGIGGCSACDISCGGPITDSCTSCGTISGPSYVDDGYTSSYGMPMSIAPSCSAPMMTAPTYSSPSPPTYSSPSPLPSPMPLPTPAPMGSSHYQSPPLPSLTPPGAHLMTPQVSSHQQFSPPIVSQGQHLGSGPVFNHNQRGPALPSPSSVQQAGWSTGRAF